MSCSYKKIFLEEMDFSISKWILTYTQMYIVPISMATNKMVPLLNNSVKVISKHIGNSLETILCNKNAIQTINKTTSV